MTLLSFCTDNQTPLGQTVVHWENTKLDDCATYVSNTTELTGGCGGNVDLGYTKISCPAGAPMAGAPVAAPQSAPMTSVPQAGPTATPTKAPSKSSNAVSIVGALGIAVSVVMTMF